MLLEDICQLMLPAVTFFPCQPFFRGTFPVVSPSFSCKHCSYPIRTCGFWPEDLSIHTMGELPSYILCQSPGRPLGARSYLMPCIYSCHYLVDHTLRLTISALAY
jgi:hypothetical protein